MEGVATVVLTLVFIVLIGLFFFERKRQAQRSKAFSLIAQKLGCDFKIVDEGLKMDFKRTIICKGRSHSVRNILSFEGDWGTAEIFEFRFQSGTEEHRRVHDQTVYQLRLSKSDQQLPSFLMEPHDFLDTIAKWFGGEYVEFQDLPEFSKRYRLRGENEKMIRSLFNDELLRLLIKRREGLFLEVVGNSMYMYREDHQAKPTKESVQDYFQRYHSIGLAFKKALEESVSIQE